MATRRGRNSKAQKSSDEEELESLHDSFEEDEKSFSESDGSDNNSDSDDNKKVSKSSKKQSKNQKLKKNISSSSESESDEEEEEEEEMEQEEDSDEKASATGSDEDEDDDEPKRPNKKKTVSPKIKFKNLKGHKRHISDVEDGEVSNSDGNNSDSSSDAGSTVSSVFNDGYDSEMIGDEEDRKRLDDMTEKEREQELFRRTEQRDSLMRQFEMKKKIKQKEKDALKAEKKKLKSEKKRESKNKSVRLGSSDEESRSKTKMGRSFNEQYNTSDDEDASISKAEPIMDRRKANESKRKETHVSKALANLKADREKKKQQAEDAKHRAERLEQQKSSKVRGGISSTSSENDSDVSVKIKKNRHHRKTRHSSDSSSRSDDDSDSDSDRSVEKQNAKQNAKLKQPLSSKEELNRVKLSRFRIEKWVHAPFFKKIACGCFVRIGIGLNAGSSIYRVAEVLDVVETSKVYTLGTTKTNKGFKLRHGEDERTYRLEFVSNQLFADSEFTRWKESMNKANIPVPTVGQIEIKSKELKSYNNYRFNDSDIDYIINEKKRFSQKSDKIAEKKIELLKEREEADQMGETDRVRDIDQLIANLNDKQQDQLMRRNGSFNLLATINQRNREESNKRVEDAMRNDYERQKGEGDDPFKRRKGYLDVSDALKKKEGAQLIAMENKQAEQKAAREKNKMAEKAAKKNDTAIVYEDLLAPVIKSSVPQVKAVELPSSYDVLHMKNREEKKDNESKQNDLFQAHNFDININLTVPTFNAPAASLAPVITNNQFSSSASHLSRRALNLDEYKKKKGLI